MSQRSPVRGRARASQEPHDLPDRATSEPADHRGGTPPPPSDPPDRARTVRRRAEAVLAEILAFEDLVDDGLAPDADGLARLTDAAADLHLDVQALAAGPTPRPADDVLAASRALSAAIEASTRILLRHLED